MNSNTETQAWGDPTRAKVLVIGHDPRLQRSSTIASYCFFADYYFRPRPSKGNDLKKYQLAESLYLCIGELTGGYFYDKEILITNLCNKALKPAPPRKTVYIPQNEAEEGLRNIEALLKASSVQLIFAMSQQVNYWLQRLQFYDANSKYLEEAQPKERGVNSEQAYYEPKKPGAFKLICGQKYTAGSKYFLFPILHVKNYPLKGKFLIYQQNYLNCASECKKLFS
jgi:hypothetical protein